MPGKQLGQQRLKPVDGLDPTTQCFAAVGEHPQCLEVSADHEADFLLAMDSMRRSRLRSGATRWELYRVGECADYLSLLHEP